MKLQVGTVRLTAFFSSEVPFSPVGKAEPAFRRVAGDLKPTRLMTSELPPMDLAEGVAADGVTVALAFSTQRVDFVWTAAVHDGPKFKFIGPADEVLSSFQYGIDEFLNVVQSACRVAVGVLYMFPADSPRDAYVILNDLIPGLGLADEKNSDFILNLNRSIESKSNPGLRINRMVNWGALAKNRTLDGDYGAKIEFDINSDAQRAVAIENIKGLVDELFDIAQDRTLLRAGL